MRVDKFAGRGKVEVTVLKTKEQVTVRWDAFFPAPLLEVCRCAGYRICRCIHESVNKFKVCDYNEEPSLG